MTTSPGSSSTSRISIFRSASCCCVIAGPAPCGSGGCCGGRVIVAEGHHAFLLAHRKRPAEHRARGHPWCGVEPEPAAMVLDDLLAHRQADAGATVGVPPVQALEDHEDLVLVLLLDADPVVAAGELPHPGLVRRPGCADVHP